MYKCDEKYLPVLEILGDILGKYKFHNEYKGQISFDCPVCSYDIKELDRGDGKGNLEVNYKDEVYKCWSCAETHETHGSLFKLVKSFGTPKQLKQFKILRPDYDNEKKLKKYDVVKLPNEFIAFKNVSKGLKLTPHYKQAINYIKKRNINDEMISKFNIGFCYSGIYEHRIIIPSYDKNNEINYFIARSYLPKTKMKYKNPEAQKDLILWNENLIDWSKPIYVVEGVFDSIFLNNSIPMLGKFMTDKLFYLLYEKAKKIIIILDGDAWNDTEKLYHKLNCGKLFGSVYAVKLPKDKDIADLQGNLAGYKEYQLD